MFPQSIARGTVRASRAALTACASLAILGVLAACGGGNEQTARTGSGGSGLGTTVGSVTGFGSVIVDGEAWDDRNARVEIERAGAVLPAESKLGQRVEIEYQQRGTADRVRVNAEVIGRVSEIGTGQFKVAGQTVRINTSAASFSTRVAAMT